MKNLFSYLTIIIGGSALLSSCNQGSGLALTKRHYTKGYYVDYTSKHETAKPKDIAAINTTDNTPIVSENNLPATGTNSGSNPIAINKEVVVKKSASKISHSAIQPTFANVTRQVGASSLLSKVTAPETLLKNQLQFENAPQSIVGTNDDGGHRVHSFFWLVITILLVLWLVGILTGSFGGLIYLLLVVALVLFILWILWLI